MVFIKKLKLVSILIVRYFTQVCCITVIITSAVGKNKKRWLKTTSFVLLICLDYSASMYASTQLLGSGQPMAKGDTSLTNVVSV